MNIQTLETVSEQLYGKSSAISLNQEKGVWVARCWDRRGIVLQSLEAKTKQAAISGLVRRLKLLDAASTPDNEE